MELLIEICTLVILVTIVVLFFLAIVFYYGSHKEISFTKYRLYEEAKTAIIGCLILHIAILFLGCTPKKKCVLELEDFHVTSIAINGEVTETDFLLTTKGEN